MSVNVDFLKKFNLKEWTEESTKELVEKHREHFYKSVAKDILNSQLSSEQYKYNDYLKSLKKNGCFPKNKLINASKSCT